MEFVLDNGSIRVALSTAGGSFTSIAANGREYLWQGGPAGGGGAGRPRPPAQGALAESFGLRSVPIDRLGQIAPAFDTVVNTVPAPVLSEAVLARLRPQSFIVDLASRPGGTDFDAARRLGHRAIHALSLPAACAPETHRAWSRY